MTVGVPKIVTPFGRVGSYLLVTKKEEHPHGLFLSHQDSYFSEI